jgi:error-prone DNA polymerase
MARLFAACPQAITATQDLLACVRFTLDDLSYEYPHEPVPPGWQAQAWLEHLVREGAKRWFPGDLHPDYEQQLAQEFRLIALKEYAHYFLTVHDIVAHARSLDPPILCQGRGSAANSLVCYFLGVTPIDPVKNHLLFTRFLSEERDEPPISTSISNTNGARRSCSMSTTAMAATARGSPPPSSDTASAAPSARSARRWGFPRM